MSLKNRLVNNETLFKEYSKFMNNMFEKNFAEKVPLTEYDSVDRRWYLCHHAVYHKQKGKIRIVFDCSLRCSGISLNDLLMKGPDLTNYLVGVLLRFRQNQFAFCADTEKMYYQVKVPHADSNYLRFFWFNESFEPIECRLNVHVFGAVSSPSIANFALQRVAHDCSNNHPDIISLCLSFSIQQRFQVE